MAPEAAPKIIGEIGPLLRRRDYHAAMKAKYERLARYPWLAVDPDPPEPD